MNSPASIRIETDGPVATVVLDRPERRNAVDGPMAAELVAACAALDADESVAAIVLTGEGDHFCAGADLTAIGSERGNSVTRDGDGPMGPTRMRLSKPVIAAVEGYAVAGGLELAAWCDLRVIGEGAVFGVFCRRWGVPLIDGGTVRLPRLIGTSRATDLILTGRPVEADEALAIGLANRLVARGTARTAAEELARQLAGFPQTCLRGDLASLHHQHGRDEVEAMAFELEAGFESLAADALAGAGRFVAGEGRHGRFEGAGDGDG